MVLSFRAISRLRLKAGGWRAVLIGLLLRVPIAVAAVWVCLILFFVVTNRMKRKVEGTAAVCSSSLRGIEFVPMDQKGRNWNLQAETVISQDRRCGKAVFTSFKDVILSHVRVLTRAGTPAGLLGWANSPDLWLLTALALAGPRGTNDDMSFLGSRLVIRDLEVYGAEGAQRPRLLLTAKEMTREGLGDEIDFKGQLTIQLNPAERITSMRTASWVPARGIMRFPEGCLVNGQNRGIKYWAAGENGGNVPKESISGAPGAFPVSQVRLAGLYSSYGQSFSPEEIGKLIKKKGPAVARRFIVQYLALNPGAFKAKGVMPMLIMGTNFKLGQFTPGPLLAPDIPPVGQRIRLPVKPVK
ncbi:MAG: hypothetical protein P4L55_20090 [Syntrophobacteraceae bacterium]|nr:hypothetical protein [Syntrophobacteraceae bacterium]